MAYLLIFDLKGNGAGRRRLSRYLRHVAHKVQYSAWEFEHLRNLERAAELIWEESGRALAFSRADEILLRKSQVKKILRKLASGNF
jgi:CRISPR/Cas system-associated endoribonuclease Cas2